MSIKLIGSVLLISGFGCFGRILSTNHKKTAALMRQLITAFAFMECELSYRLTSLPDLLRRAVDEDGVLKRFFLGLAEELEGQISPNVSCCVEATLASVPELPEMVKTILRRFGNNAGCFDLESQIQGIASVREDCAATLAAFTRDQETRLRNYQSLAICAGAAVAILLF
jgi:stage III sporulation protein AB